MTMSYQVPTFIGTGYLTVPEFLQAGIIKAIGDADKGESGVMDDFESDKFKTPFAEIRIYNQENRPSIIDKLIGCRIPFHFNYTYQEDMEISYWHGLNKATREIILGYDTTVAASKRPNLYFDYDWLEINITNIKAQLKMLGGDVDALLEARDIYDTTK